MKDDEIWTEERCFIRELLNTPESPNVSLAIARVEPGVTTQLHALSGVKETYIIRKGNGIVEVDGLETSVGINDKVFIDENIPQRITNIGNEDLEFYCLCSPRFHPESYINLE